MEPHLRSWPHHKRADYMTVSPTLRQLAMVIYLVNTTVNGCQWGWTRHGGSMIIVSKHIWNFRKRTKTLERRMKRSIFVFVVESTSTPSTIKSCTMSNLVKFSSGRQASHAFGPISMNPIDILASWTSRYLLFCWKWPSKILFRSCALEDTDGYPN